MHGNYHRKDSAIIQEGFQRFRATENCKTPSCVFADQKTTHFHCRRSGCSFTFKNKSDMGKLRARHVSTGAGSLSYIVHGDKYGSAQIMY